MESAIHRLESARLHGDSFLPLEGETRFGFGDGRDIAAWLEKSGYAVKESGVGRGNYGYALTECGLLVESHGYVTSNVATFEQFCREAA